MNDARAAILARLAAAQRTAHIPDVTAIPRTLALETRTEGECLERFRAELTLLGVDNHLEGSAADVRARVASLIAGRRVLAWDVGRLPYETGSLLKDDACFGRSPRDLQARAEIGLTGCHGAVAETGSLAVLSGPGTSRAVSLLPALHIAMVSRADLVWSMGEFFQKRKEAMDAAAACVFITGPSRTADIELSLTLGVHGPGKVVVVIGP